MYLLRMVNNMKLREKSRWQRFKDKLPKMELCFSKLKIKSKVGKVAFVIVPLVLAGASIGIGVNLLNKEDKPVTKVETGANTKNRRIYLASNDNLTIPLTVKLAKRGTAAEELIEIFNLLKTDSKANTTSIKGLIPKDTKLNSLELFNDELILDVSSEFLNYDESKEINILESLVYTFSEYPEVNMLSIYVDGERLLKMPKTETVIPEFLETSFGINRDHRNTTDVAGKNRFNIYYTKTYDGASYLVPVSQYVENEGDVEVQLLKASKERVPSTYGLELASAYNHLATTQKNTEDSKLTINLNSSAMKEEGVIKKEVYDIVSLTLEEYQENLEVSFYVEEIEMMVEGLIDTSTYEVSDLIYNAIEL